MVVERKKKTNGQQRRHLSQEIGFRDGSRIRSLLK